jgi:hypothetical protein
MSKLYQKFVMISFVSVLACNAYAEIPYCPGTHLYGSKNMALQRVVKHFADQNACEIGSNCLLNFDQVKYSIAWTEPCRASAAKGNDPKGSTFICEHGMCTPYGFSSPAAGY